MHILFVLYEHVENCERNRNKCVNRNLWFKLQLRFLSKLLLLKVNQHLLIQEYSAVLWYNVKDIHSFIHSRCSGFHSQQMDDHVEGNPSRSLTLSELSGTRLPRLLFESVMNGARKCVSVLGANLRWPVFQSSIRPKLGPALTATLCFYPGPGFVSDRVVKQKEFPGESDPFLLPTFPLSLFLFVYFLAYLFSEVNSPYAKHIDCGKALENAHLCRLYPCAWARCESSAGCLEVVDITSSFGQAAESALCIKWGLPKDRFRSICQEFCSTINLNVAIRIW